MTDSLNANRLHGIDFCRAFFMLLGLFFHAGLIYGADQNWRVVSGETSWVISSFSAFIHTFRMEAFYLISGFFYLLVFSKGRDGFLGERLGRALIPLIFCGVLFNTIMNVLSYNKIYSWNIDYMLQGQWLGHLWFLGNLIVYFLVSLPLCKIIMKGKAANIYFCQLSFYILLPVACTVSSYITMLTIDVRFFFVSFDSLLYFYCFFILGCFCYKNKNVFLSLLSVKYFFISLGVYSLLSFITAFDSYFDVLIVKAAKKLSVGPLILSIMAMVYIVGRKNNTIVRNLSDASYTIYLLHQPLMVALYVVLFKGYDFGVYTEYFILILSVFCISYFFHMLLVRRNKYLRFLFNGVSLSQKR